MSEPLHHIYEYLYAKACSQWHAAYAEADSNEGQKPS